MRTNPSPKSGNSKGERIVSRVPRRRTASTKAPGPVALPTVSEENIPVQGVSIEDQIAQLAYFLWKERGENGGSAEEDWYRAEQEILARSRS